MKSKKAIIGALLGIITLSLWVGRGYSQEGSAETASNRPLTCKGAVVNEMKAMRTGWDGNLTALLDQEKPASEMVDEAYESLRTYRCWLNYLCSSVTYSGAADPRVIGDRPLTSAEIDPIPGCVAPEKLKIPDTSVHFIAECKVTTAENVLDSGTITAINDNFQACQDLVAREIGMVSDPDSSPDNAAAFVALERALKARSGEQLLAPVREKLVGIANGLSGMESHMMVLKDYLDSLYNRIPCFCPKCN